MDESLNFNIVGWVESFSADSPVHTTIDDDADPVTPEVPVSHQIVLSDGQSLSLYCVVDHKSYNYLHDESSAPENHQIAHDTYIMLNLQNQDLVVAGNGQTMLYCYSDYPKGGLTQAQIDTFSSEAELYHGGKTFDGSVHIYSARIQGSKLLLWDNSNNAEVSTVGLNLENLSIDGFLIGLESGRMLPAPLPEPVTVWDIYDAPLSYRWSRSGLHRHRPDHEPAHRSRYGTAIGHTGGQTQCHR